MFQLTPNLKERSKKGVVGVKRYEFPENPALICSPSVPSLLKLPLFQASAWNNHGYKITSGRLPKEFKVVKTIPTTIKKIIKPLDNKKSGGFFYCLER